MLLIIRIYPPTQLFNHPFTHPTTNLPSNTPIHLLKYPSINQPPISPSIYPPTQLSIYTSIHPSISSFLPSFKLFTENLEVTTHYTGDEIQSLQTQKRPHPLGAAAFPLSMRVLEGGGEIPWGRALQDSRTPDGAWGGCGEAAMGQHQAQVGLGRGEGWEGWGPLLPAPASYTNIRLQP